MLVYGVFVAKYGGVYVIHDNCNQLNLILNALMRTRKFVGLHL